MEHLKVDLFEAYYDARKNKRNTINALVFEENYESNLLTLYRELTKEKYKIRRSICFISNYPVKREIFAADFRDRIIHHLVYNYISSIFEKIFIHDSYSCRTGKGTSYGVKRIDSFNRKCSQNYKKDCYILKLDISGYFMSINKEILHKQIKRVLQNKEVVEFDTDFILDLIKKVIFNDPRVGCSVKGKRSDWHGLPKSKSLFFAKDNCGLPIGNLTSQLFGNIYLNDFDHFVKHKLKVKYYGRYVDDFVLIHGDKEYLLSLIPVMNDYLQKNLSLQIHPKKIYLQHCSKGLTFLGRCIKPYRIYIGKRTKGSLYKKIKYWNKILEENNNKMSEDNLRLFLASINSYLGMMRHYDSYKLRKKMLSRLSPYFWNYVYISGGYKLLKTKTKKKK